MDDAVRQLWHINSEYQKRLQQARTYLDLLEQLVLSRGAEAQALNTLRRVRLDLESLAEEHRSWRHQYYYKSLDSRRMVQSEGDISRALLNFSQMRARHEFELRQLRSLLYRIQRPDPSMTRVPVGDLWVMAETAMHNLSGFEDYVRSLS